MTPFTVIYLRYKERWVTKIWIINQKMIEYADEWIYRAILKKNLLKIADY